MSKRYKRPPVNLLDFLDTKERDDALPLVVGDATFYVKPMTSLSDTALANFEAVQMGGGNTVAMIRDMVDDYDGLCAALDAAGRPGGAAAAVMAIVGEAAEALEDGQGADLPESGASSGS